MLNIVIPMAGKGIRFYNAGYSVPKPFILIHGVPMFKVVLDNLRPRIPHRFILVCLKEDMKKLKLKNYCKNLEIIGIDEITEGQVCSILQAKEFINNDEPLMTANVDQYIDLNINTYLNHMESGEFDGLIMTMKSKDPKCSFVYANQKGMALKTAEKEVISDDATVGIYNFRRGSDLVRSAEKLISLNLRINNEFYISPCFNLLIQEGKRIGVYSIGSDTKGMYGLGTPEDLKVFINHPISKKVILENENIRA